MVLGWTSVLSIVEAYDSHRLTVQRWWFVKGANAFPTD